VTHQSGGLRDGIAEALRSQVPRRADRPDFRQAAVLLPLYQSETGPHLILTKRTEEVPTHKGQIAFPGGGFEEGDADLLTTAIRETREEIGIDLSRHADVLGHMAPRAPANRPDVLVVPFVALARGRVEPSIGAEVTSTFWAPLADLPETLTTTDVRTSVGPLRVPAFVHEGRVIWGFTYRVLEELLALLERGA